MFYLDRVAERSMASLRDLRAQAFSVPTGHTPGLEEEEVLTLDDRFADRVPSPGESVSRSVEVSSPQPHTAPHTTSPDAEVALRQGPPGADAGQQSPAFDAREVPPRAVAPVLPLPRTASVQTPSLRDAGIRHVTTREAVAPTPARSERAGRSTTGDGFETRAERRAEGRVPGDAPSPPTNPSTAASGVRRRQAAVPAPRVEQWQRLKERLLAVHGPVAPAPAGLATSGSQQALAAREARSTDPEIVIGELEVIVAPPVPPATPAPAAAAPAHPAARSGAWSAATRRYLGKL